MRVLHLIWAAAAFLCFLAGQASATYLALDDFDYNPAGSPLSGHGDWGLITNAGGSPDPTIAAGSLSHPDRLANAGNSVQLTGTGASGNSKLPLSSLQSAGTVYYSMLVEVSDISNLTNTTTGSFFAGFQPHNLISPAVSSVATAAANMLIHRDANDANAYNLGIAVTTGNADRIFDTTPLLQGDTVFVVVGYQMNPDADDDVAFLWINPSPASYGALVAPSPTVTSDGALSATPAADHGPASSFYFRNNGVEPDFMLADDLRVATTWAEVTRLVAIPEPATVVLLAVGTIGLIMAARRQ